MTATPPSGAAHALAQWAVAFRPTEDTERHLADAVRDIMETRAAH